MTRTEQRTRQYIGIQRWEEALAELAQAMSEEPDNGELYALQALCLGNMGKVFEAETAARRATGLQPDNAYCHYILANVFQMRGMFARAEETVLEAIRLDPDEANYYSMLSSILGLQARWHASVAAAEDGLRLNPQHPGCLRLRAQGLSFLGKSKEANDTAWHAVATSPDSAAAHSELGWVNLRAGKNSEAERHFKEALRLDPNSKRARGGLFESLRARFPPYRSVLRLFARVNRVPLKTRRIIFLTGFLTFVLAANLSEAMHRGKDLLMVLMAIYFAVMYLALLGRGLLNVIVVLHPLGRLAMSRYERAQASAVVAFLSTSILLALISLVLPHKFWMGAGFTFGGCLLMALLARLETPGRGRWLVLWGTLAVWTPMSLVMIFAPLK